MGGSVCRASKISLARGRECTAVGVVGIRRGRRRLRSERANERRVSFRMSIVPIYTDRAWRLGAHWRCRVGLQKTWKTSRILRMRHRKLAHASTMALRLTLAGATIATGFWMKGAGLVVVVGLAAESEAPCRTMGVAVIAD